MLYDKRGTRKYLTDKERDALFRAIASASAGEQTFLLMMAYTGARISEVLALVPSRIDLDAEVVVIESLKKRRPGVFRAIPLPSEFLFLIEKVHGLEGKRMAGTESESRIWPWGRTKAWMVVKNAMRRAQIPDARAMPKTLRHTFGVGATQLNVPINILQKWMGHSRIATTAIYADAVGEEERGFAERLWGSTSLNLSK